MAARVFMSYSHKDEKLRDELEVHLSMLKRQGVIDVWHDRRMMPGDHIDEAIKAELEKADIILLLISPDFLASDYCYEIEKNQAMDRHHRNEARVVSLILRPCEWVQTDLGKYLVTPTDGKPITQWPNRDSAFLDVTKSLRRAVEEIDINQPSKSNPISSPSFSEVSKLSLPRSSNMRLKKIFTKEDEDEFMLGAYEFIDKFFQGSLAELQARNADVRTRYRHIDANCFTAIIYRNGEKVSDCTIRLGGMFANGITFSYGDNPASNSHNESLFVEKDDQKLFLRVSGMQSMGMSNRERTVSWEGAAEYLWELLIQRLQGGR